MATGSATLDFGSTPTDEALVTVSGLSGLSVGSFMEAYIQASDSTLQNTTDDHRALAFSGKFSCEYVSASSFNIHCDLTIGLMTGQYTIRYVTA